MIRYIVCSTIPTHKPVNFSLGYSKIALLLLFVDLGEPSMDFRQQRMAPFSSGDGSRRQSDISNRIWQGVYNTTV